MNYEEVFLNFIIKKNRWDLVTENGIDESYFESWSHIYTFVKSYVEQYGSTPAFETVKEIDKSLVDYEVIGLSDREVLDLLRNKYVCDNTTRITEIYKSKYRDTAPTTLAESVGVVQGLITELQSVLDKNSVAKAMNSATLSEYLKKEFIARRDNRDAFVYKTGFPFFDEVFHGWDKENDYVVISGRPGTGKSMLLCLLAAEQLKAGKKIVFYEGEMNITQTVERILAHLSEELSETDMYLGNESIQDKYFALIDKYLSGDNFYILTPEMIGGKYATASLLEAQCRKVGADLLFIDQQSLMEDEDHAKQFFERASNISRQIKGVRDRLNIPVITAVQQNRTKIEGGGVDTVQIAGSDTIVQDASKVIMINKPPKDAVYVTISISKNRSGKSYVDKEFLTDFAHCQFYEREADASNHPVSDTKVTKFGKSEKKPQTFAKTSYDGGTNEF